MKDELHIRVSSGGKGLKPGEYFISRKGQASRHLNRYINRIRLSIKHQAKSKKSLRLNEKIDFQKQVLAQLRDSRKRAYRSNNIILEIQFYSNMDNPPALHTMAKTYLDLLYKPLDSKQIPRKRLLIQDDRDVKILNIQLELISKESEPYITIEADSISNLKKDMELIQKIRSDDFPNDDTSSYGSFSDEYWGSYNIENEYHLMTSLQELDDWRRDRNKLIERFGFQSFTAIEYSMVQETQYAFLKTHSLTLSKLYSFIENQTFSSFKDRDDEELISLGKKRDAILSNLVSLDFKHLPIKEGDTKKFQSHVEFALEEFKIKYPILFPLKTQLGIVIICLPPIGKGIDLDNLGRYIVPVVHRILEPPSSFYASQPDWGSNKANGEDIFARELKMQGRIPKHSISQYQIIELPRFPSDADEGFVKMFLCDGRNPRSILFDVGLFIDEWEQTID